MHKEELVRLNGKENLVALGKNLLAAQMIFLGLDDLFIHLHLIADSGAEKFPGNHPAIELGGSPRAGISLIKASRARALIHGRDFVTPADLFALAEDTILHRLRLCYEALADGLTTQVVLEEMLKDMGATPSTTGAAAGGPTAATNGTVLSSDEA